MAQYRKVVLTDKPVPRPLRRRRRLTTSFGLPRLIAKLARAATSNGTRVACDASDAQYARIHAQRPQIRRCLWSWLLWCRTSPRRISTLLESAKCHSSVGPVSP